MIEDRPLMAGDEPPWVYSGGETTFDFPFGKLISEVGGGSPSVRICLLVSLRIRFLHACLVQHGTGKQTKELLHRAS